MGWKSVKEHYRIEHFVTIEDEWGQFERKPTGDQLLCIGSPLCHDLISINLRTWKFKRAMSGSLHQLQRVWDEMHADLSLLADLVAVPDTFEKSIPVYTYKDGEIIECKCEELGWPNVTHDGQMQYENKFFADRSDAVVAGIRNAEAWIESSRRWLSETEEQLAKAKAQLARAEGSFASLSRESAPV